MTRFEVQTHEKVVAGERQDLDHTLAVFTIGFKDDLGKKALATAVLSWRALDIKPSTMIVMHLGGYDDHPRELWQIPEVRRFVQKFCAKTSAHKHPAIEPMSRGLLLACGADPALRVAVDMISPAPKVSRERAVSFRTD